MERTKVNELKAERKQLIDQARELLDTAENESRDLSAEESERYDKLNADIDALGKRAERMEQQIEREERAGQFDYEPQRPDPEDRSRAETTESPRATDDYRTAFWSYIRRSHSGLYPQEVRQLNIGTDAEGGYLVPDEFHGELIEELEEQNVMRSLATVIQTGSGDRLIPLVTDYGNAQWINEQAAYPEQDTAFDRVTLGAHKLARITRVTEELLNDSMFDIGAHVQNAFRRAFGDAEEAAFVDGDGTGKPTGVIRDAQANTDAAAVDAIAGDELLDLYHALRRPYRARATWLMNDSTALALRKLKDGNDQYLWQPGLQAGQPDRILGRPVAISEFMPDLGAENTPVAFGDFSYYYVADRQSIGIQRLVELYAANGMVGFRMFMRVDGKLVLPETVQVLTNAAA